MRSGKFRAGLIMIEENRESVGFEVTAHTVGPESGLDVVKAFCLDIIVVVAGNTITVEHSPLSRIIHCVAFDAGQ